MALLPPGFLNSVVAIGTIEDDSDTEIHWIGTGFIYGVDANDSGSDVYPFLVTNRHILENDGTIVVKMNRTDDLPANEYAFDIERVQHNITTHPDSDVDVAVMPVPVDVWIVDQSAANIVQERQSLSRAAAGEIGVSEGDGVFAVGFPLGLVEYENQIFPIVRQGCIARIQDWLSGRARRILIDANIFPGNSGGPVFLRPTAMASAGANANDVAYLIGMVSGYIPYREVAVSPQTNQARVVFEENSGIAEIVPSDAILETIQIAVQRLGLTD